MTSEQELRVDEDEEVEAEESLQELESKRDGDSDRDIESEEPLAEVRYLEVVTVLEQMLEGKAVDEEKLAGLAEAERDALLFFRQVVDGRTSSNEFMYAERRLEGLNRVLAALQPALSVGGAHQVLHESLLDVIDGIEQLRQKLVGLEDAEEEIVAVPEEKAVEGDKDDDDDKDKAAKDKAAQDKAARDKAAKAKSADDLDLDNQQQQRKRKSDAWDPDAPDEPEPAKPEDRRSTLE